MRSLRCIFCIKQTAVSLSRLAQKSLRSLRFLSTDCGRRAPERKNKKDRKNRENKNSCHSCFSCRSCPSCSPLFTGIFFNTRAPRAHLKPALRIVGGKATDLSVAAAESRKAVKKRRRQTLCLRSIRFRLCDSRLRQRCGAWLLRHFCHQKWQRTCATRCA